MEFKDVLRKERIRSGMTQEELGAKVGLKKSAIHKYENGLTINPGRTLIFKLAQALNVSPCYLLTGEDGKQKQGDFLTDIESELISDFRSLNAEGQGMVASTAKALANNPAYKASNENDAPILEDTTISSA